MTVKDTLRFIVLFNVHKCNNERQRSNVYLCDLILATNTANYVTYKLIAFLCGRYLKGI